MMGNLKARSPGAVLSSLDCPQSQGDSDGLSEGKRPDSGRLRTPIWKMMLKAGAGLGVGTQEEESSGRQRASGDI